MTTDIFRSFQVRTHLETAELTGLDIYMLKRAHPAGIIVDLIGWVWFGYFFWQHNWQMAVGALIIGRFFSLIAVMDVNPSKMAETTLGKIALLHLLPVNMLIQSIGIIILLYGVWFYSIEISFIGLSIVGLGHLFGWPMVASNFERDI